MYMAGASSSLLADLLLVVTHDTSVQTSFPVTEQIYLIDLVANHANC